MAELERSKVPERQKAAARGQLRRQHAAVRAVRRRNPMDALYNDAGEALHTAEAAGAALAEYWTPVFNRSGGDEELQREFLDFVQPVGQDFRWSWARGRTRELAEVAHNSAPGKGGLPYRFWRHAPENYHTTLDDIVEAVQHGGRVPSDMHDSATTFIPKTEIGQEAAAARRTAGLVRPVTLMNTSEKILTIGVNHDIMEVVDKGVCDAQQGFVQGRLIDRAVLGLDGAVTALSVQRPLLGVGVLMDFAQAFPSLAHDFCST